MAATEVSVASTQRLVQVRDDVVCILDPDGQSDHFRPRARSPLLLFRQLAVHHAGRVGHERAAVAEVGD